MNELIKYVGTTGADVTPDDATDLPNSGALYVGTEGDVKATLIGGGTVIFKNVPAGTFMPIMVNRVFATGTTAADLVVLT